MGNYLNVGQAGFESAVKGIYVDKTELIAFINSKLGTKDKLTCVSRPRRFGKSFAAQMLCAYYDRTCDSHGLFEGFEIAKDPSFEKYINQYDVIYLDLTWFIANTKDMNDVVSTLQEEVITELLEAYPDIKKENTLPEMLSSVSASTGNKFIIIIDEWDALFREAKENTALQEEYIFLLRGLFRSGVITDKMIEGAYMTGILPIKKYGTQSAVSDFQEYTMLSPEPLEKYVGFTESEVTELCKKYDVDFDEMKRWYDGYSLQQYKSIYNPNSVMQAVKRHRFGSYWARTETYESLKIYIDMNLDGLKEAIVRMLGEERVRIDAETFQNDMSNIKMKDDVLTLLVHLGYLAYDQKNETVYIPNEELRKEFIRAVTGSKHKEMVKLIQITDDLLELTLRMDEEAVAAAVEEVHKTYSSPIHYNNEQSLRGTIRFAYLGCIEDFTRIDELPSGHGYADIAFIPKQDTSKPVILIELKWNHSTESAVGQILDRDYPHVFKDYSGDILLVGINYDADTKKHTCKIEKHTK